MIGSAEDGPRRRSMRRPGEANRVADPEPLTREDVDWHDPEEDVVVVGKLLAIAALVLIAGGCLAWLVATPG
jgi:hypothetical protein